MWKDHCGSLEWGIGGQEGVRGTEKQQAAMATEDWLYVRGIDQINKYIMDKGNRFSLPDRVSTMENDKIRMNPVPLGQNWRYQDEIYTYTHTYTYFPPKFCSERTSE